MKNKIQITVSGQVNSGKTTIIDLINKVLKESGFTTTVEDDSRPCLSLITEEFKEQRKKAVSEKTEVSIKSVQLSRQGHHHGL
jgi:thymidylate kinase